MRDIMRFVTTLFIWGMAGAIMLASVITSSTGDSGIIVPLVLFLSVAASISTIGVWMGARSEPTENKTLQAKGKRAQPRRVERLIAELDDDEIYDLETLLLARDDAAERSPRGR